MAKATTKKAPAKKHAAKRSAAPAASSKKSFKKGKQQQYEWDENDVELAHHRSIKNENYVSFYCMDKLSGRKHLRAAHVSALSPTLVKNLGLDDE